MVFITCNSPDSWDCLRSAGKETTEIREIQPFRAVSIFDKLDVEFVQDGELFVEIKAGKNLLPGIKTEQSDDQLVIKNDNRCELIRNSDKRAKLIIHFDTLQNIEIFSSGTVSSKDTIKLDRLLFSKRSNGDLFMTVNVENLFIYSNEYGDAYFNGRIQSASSRQEGVGLVDFSKCEIENADIFSQGPGTTKVNCRRSIRAITERNGIIRVFGNPQDRDITVRDEGQIIFED
jgi:hypothetical protein